ncbi:alpha/beta fold hydrolase [Herbiconiux solani]|uniref:alpha/beta fold hydrolase n=1 Tax=Herbiconiux solani TaxID=661329 RepID=UPI000825CE4B|nr:alpha/beta hydrolase [Herbiconiux solani]
MGTLQTLSLPDGRTLAFRVYGDPDGFVVVNCHGGMMSGLDAELSDDAARARGLAIVSPDRPGVGGSSRREGHGMLTWARTDLSSLLDHLGARGFAVDRFGVMGWSEGGQYALAIGHVHPERVTAIALVAGALPLDDSGTFAELNHTDQRLGRLAERAPLVARAGFAATRVFTRALPRLAARISGSALDPRDAAVIEGRHDWFSRTVVAGLRDSRGAVDQYRAFTGPWGFSPEEVPVPVVVHQGGADRMVPAAWAETFARRLPSASLRRYPEDGHFISISRGGEVLDTFSAR